MRAVLFTLTEKNEIKQYRVNIPRRHSELIQIYLHPIRMFSVCSTPGVEGRGTPVRFPDSSPRSFPGGVPQSTVPCPFQGVPFPFQGVPQSMVPCPIWEGGVYQSLVLCPFWGEPQYLVLYPFLWTIPRTGVPPDEDWRTSPLKTGYAAFLFCKRFDIKSLRLLFIRQVYLS